MTIENVEKAHEYVKEIEKLKKEIDVLNNIINSNSDYTLYQLTSGEVSFSYNAVNFSINELNYLIANRLKTIKDYEKIINEL